MVDNKNIKHPYKTYTRKEKHVTQKDGQCNTYAMYSYHIPIFNHDIFFVYVIEEDFPF